MIIIINNNNILKFAIDNDIINYDDILAKINMKNRKEILSKHTFNIWEASDGRWKTYIEDSSKKNGRKLIAKSSKKAIEDYIVEEYQRTHDDSYLVKNAFKKWINEASEKLYITKTTADRYLRDYNRFILNTEFSQKDIRTISEKEVIGFLKEVIYSRQDDETRITRKAFNNLKTIIRGLFLYFKTEYDLNCVDLTIPFKELKFPSKLFKKNVRRDCEQVFSIDETKMIATYVMEHNHTTKDLGILLAFSTGLRVGELSTLKISDQYNHQLLVSRTEIEERDEFGNSTIKIREFPKSEASMNVIELNDTAYNILLMIRKENIKNGITSDFLFYDEKYGRIKSRAFTKRLKRICENLNILPRSMHKIRKTYASTLFACGLEEKIIQNQLRHKDISTTHNYYEFSVRNSGYIQEKLHQADMLNDVINV